MEDKHKILWVEDGALYELAHLAGPIYLDGDYELHVAEDVSGAIDIIQKEKFQTIIVDIRLPPGANKQWLDIYKRAGNQKAAASLGLSFLKTILGSSKAEVKIDNRPSWLTASMIGVLTVESSSELHSELEELGIRFYQRKSANMAETALLDIVKQICHR